MSGVGILQVIWKKDNGALSLVGYATAWAISPSLIVTCAHAIFETTNQTICSEAYFIPVNGISG